MTWLPSKVRVQKFGSAFGTMMLVSPCHAWHNDKEQQTGNVQVGGYLRAFSVSGLSARCLNVCITSVSGNVESLRRSPISNTSNLYLLMVHICNSQLRSHVVSSNRLWRPMAAPCNSETGWCWSYFCKRCIQCVHVKLTFFLTWRTCVCDDLQWRT